MKLRKVTLLVVASLVVWSAAGCGRKRSDPIAGGGNSETHFLEECTDRCSGGLACVCGVCTKSCEDASDCSALSPDAACVATCTEAPASLMCDVPCRTTSDCAELGSESSCRAGRCRFGEAGAGGSGSGGMGAMPAGGAGGRGGSGGASAQGGAGGEAGSDEVAGRAGTSSGAGGASDSNGGTGAGGAAGKSGGGLGAIEVTNATSLRLAAASTWCQKLFECPVLQGDDPQVSRLEFRTPERCFELFSDPRALRADDRDLDAKLEAGTIELHADELSACLDALSDCSQPIAYVDNVASCRAIFRGSSPLGGPCSRPEDCADDVDCLVETTCPGTCTERAPLLLGLGAECNNSSDCDHSPGDVECAYLSTGYGPTCALVTRFPPAKVDEPCSHGGTEIRPCAEGLYCERGEDAPVEYPPNPGTCLAPRPLGATCGGYVPCADADAMCIDGTCQSLTLAHNAGDACGDPVFCDGFERLFCNEGVCELKGNGTEGARCYAVDYDIISDCEPGLICLRPADLATSEWWSTCGKPRVNGETCYSSFDCESGNCLPNHTCADGYCCQGVDTGALSPSCMAR